MNALLYCPSGGGKTVQSTRVNTGKRGRNILLCSDNSSIVLNQPQFKRDNLDIQTIEHWMDKDSAGNPQTHFHKQFTEAVSCNKYDNIIVDNLSDLFDMAILEMSASGKYNDIRQAYQIVYQSLKRLARSAGLLECNVVFTAWADQIPIVLPDGTASTRIQPKLPSKILDNVCGLCNIVAYISTANDKEGKKQWYYITAGTPQLYAKNQVSGTASCMPEHLFSGEGAK